MKLPDDPAEFVGKVIRFATPGCMVKPKRIFSLGTGAYGETLLVIGCWSRRHVCWSYEAVREQTVRNMVRIGWWKVMSR